MGDNDWVLLDVVSGGLVITGLDTRSVEER